jgi:hypothetical protein
VGRGGESRPWAQVAATLNAGGARRDGLGLRPRTTPSALREGVTAGRGNVALRLTRNTNFYVF